MSDGGILDYHIGIKMAVLELAYDNGMINRLEGREKFLDFCGRRISTINKGLRQMWSSWLVSLPDEDFHSYICGEETERKTIAEHAPEGLEEYLDYIFENYELGISYD